MKWRVPAYRLSIPTPFGTLVAGTDGSFTARSEEEDDWFYSQGAALVRPLTEQANLDQKVRFHMVADRPEASAATADTFVFIRDEGPKGTMYFDTGESLVQMSPPVGSDELWTPAQLSGLLEGWMADDLVGANASAVRGWVGLKGMTLINSAAGSRPLLYTTDASKMINGRQVVTFDGSNDSLSLNGLVDPFATPMTTVIAICRPNPPGAAEGALWCSADEGGANTWVWGGYDATATSKHVYHQRNAGDTEDVLTGPDCTATPQVIEWSSNAAKWSLRLKHSVQALTVTSGANNGHGFLKSTGRDNFSIGTRKLAGESRNWRGDLAALFILTNITPAERAMLFSWIAANYALGL
jgi:hypothetical protein